MAGYESHGVSCGRCGESIEWGSYGGDIQIYLNFSREVERSEWGTVSLGLSRYGLEEYDHEVEDGENGYVNSEEWRCQNCEEELNESRIVFWAWDGCDGYFSLGDSVLQDELGRRPDEGSFYFSYEGERVQGEIMDAKRFRLSLKGELEDKAWAEESPGLTEVAAPPFQRDGENGCHEEDGISELSPWDDDGGDWACELEAGHEGPCRIEPGRYGCTFQGNLVDAWEDGEWVIAVEAESQEAYEAKIREAVLEELHGDPLAEMGL